MEQGRDHETRSQGAGALAATTGSAAFALFEFVLAVVITRGLGVAEAGVFFAVMSLFMIALGVLMIGPVQGLIRSVAHSVELDRADDVRHLIAIAAIPSVVASAALGVGAAVWAAPISASVVGGPEAEPYLRAMAPLLPAAVAMHVVLAASRGMGSMKPTVVLDRVGVGAARPLLVGVAILIGAGPIVIGVSWGIAYALALIGAWFWVQRLVSRISRRGRPSVTPVTSLARSLWAFSAVRGGAAGMELITRWSDIPLVAALASPEAAGIYAAVSRLTLAGEVALRGVMLSFTPRISALLARGDRRAAQDYYKLATGWSMAASLPIYSALVAYPALLLEPFGSGFGAGATALMILCSAKLATALVGPITIVLLMEGRTWLNVINAAVAVAINVGLNLWLIPAMGIEGAAIAWAASLLFLYVAPMIQLYRAEGYQPVGRGWGVIVAVTAVTIGGLGVLLPRGLGLSELGSFVVFAAVASPAYAYLLYRERRVTGLDVLFGSLGRSRASAQAMRPR